MKPLVAFVAGIIVGAVGTVGALFVMLADREGEMGDPRRDPDDVSTMELMGGCIWPQDDLETYIRAFSR